MQLKHMRMCRLLAVLMLLSCLFTVSLFGQNNLLMGQGGGQSSGQSQGQGNGTGQGQSGMSSGGFQPLGHGQMQPSIQSLGITPGEPTSITPQAIMKLVAQNPELANEIKILILERLRQQGRTPPGGRLTPQFVMSEIQNDPVLKTQLIQLLQQKGLLPPSAGGAGGAAQTGALTAGAIPGGMNNGTGNGMNTGVGILNNNGTPAAGIGTAQMALTNPEPNPMQLLPQQQLAPSTQTLQPTGVQPGQAQPTTYTQPSPYGDLQSLQLLYTQVPEDTTELKRFGTDVFTNGTGNTDQLPADVPAGPEYVLGSGDVLNVHLWGGVEQDFSETVDRAGRIELPSTRSMMVAGQTMQEAEESIRRALSTQFKNTKVEISLARVRTVRIYVVGDVLHPGAYDVSSLSTPLSGLFVAGGPTEQGSLRVVRHMRGGKLIETVDLYDLLLKGVDKGLTRLDPGDTILVTPVGPQVTVAGLVRRPAIYEVKKGADLAGVIELAGGLQVSASVDEINIDRVEERTRHFTMNLKVPKGADEAAIKKMFASVEVKDGDRVTISSILPNREDTIFLEGHVFRPGRRAFKSGMQVTDVIHSLADLLPEAAERAEIIRLVSPEHRPTTIEFDLSEVFSGNRAILLQPFDTIRVFGRYDFDSPNVSISGPVLFPGEYPLGEKMKVSELIRLAGGFKRSAFLGEADLTSYSVQNGEKVLTAHRTVSLKEALKGNPEADAVLRTGDVLTIRALAGWEDIGASVILTGEVMHPGTYGITVGEKLSSLIQRAGGFRDTAFPQGADLEREEVRALAEKSKQELIDRIQTEGLTVFLKSTAQSPIATSESQDVGKEQQNQMQAMMMQQKQVLDSLRNQTASGRLVIEIGPNVEKWKNTAADVELRNGDELNIPKKSDIVMVNGQVYNPSAQTYIPGRSVAYYLFAAGGFTDMANHKNIFVVRANGAVISNGGKHLGHGHGDVMATKVKPGDVVIVPEKVVRGSVAWRNAIAMAQAISGMALTARVATSF